MCRKIYLMTYLVAAMKVVIKKAMVKVVMTKKAIWNAMKILQKPIEEEKHVRRSSGHIHPTSPGNWKKIFLTQF